MATCNLHSLNHSTVERYVNDTVICTHEIGLRGASVDERPRKIIIVLAYIIFMA